MPRKLPAALALACLAALPLAPAAAQETAGVVKIARGDVRIQRADQTLAAGVGTTVLAGDVLRTGSESSAGVTLKDDTRVALGANSQVSLDKYAFNANTHEGNLLVSIFKGTLMMISGLLVKSNPAAARLKTPNATIGIRGTEFIVEVP